MSVPTQASAGLTVTTGPGTADAQLVVQLAQLATSMDLDRGNAILWPHRTTGGLPYAAFQELPLGSAESNAVLNVMKWHETVGTLVGQGLLDRGLVLDWLWVSGAWDMCRAIATAMREETGVAGLWENFEALAASQT